MNRKPYVGKRMYAIFSNANGTHIQNCDVTKVEEKGFYANCHNGGDGIEFFENEDLGKGIFFSKDSAEIALNRENKKNVKP